MNIIYTVATNYRYYRLAERLGRKLKDFGWLGEFRIIENNNYPEPGYQAMTDLTEESDFADFDDVLFIEADVDVTKVLVEVLMAFKNQDKIIVEKRNAIARDVFGPSYPNVQLPYTGMIYIPKRYKNRFFQQWREAYKSGRSGEEILLIALDGMQWGYSNEMRCNDVPDEGQAFVHYTGGSKRLLK